MKDSTKLVVGIVCCVLLLALFGAGLYGYVENIILLAQNAAQFGAKEGVRVLGIILPFLGAVMGYIN